MRVFKLVVVIVGLFLLIQMGAATPLDSRFTFQGRYEDNGTPINGTRTLYFILWDAAENGNQIGSAQIVNEIQIVDGNFTVLLNSGNEFGADAFNGEERWLQIAECLDGECNGIKPFFPRQRLTAVPYSAYSLSAPWEGIADIPEGFSDGVDNSGDSLWGETGPNIFYNQGNVGVGETNPGFPLTIHPPVDTFYGWLHTDGTRELGSYLNEFGGSIGTRSNHNLNFFTHDSLPDLTLTTSGNLGIGTRTPASKVDISNVSLFGPPPTTPFDALRITGYHPFITLRESGEGNPQAIIQNRDGEIAFYPDGSMIGVPPVSITKSGNVAIGTTLPSTSARLTGYTLEFGGTALRGEAPTGNGVVGTSSAAGYGAVAGINSGSVGIGVYGEAPTGNGVVGKSASDGFGAVAGSSTAFQGIGVYGEANSASATGVSGISSSGTGIYGKSSAGPGLNAGVVAENKVGWAFIVLGDALHYGFTNFGGDVRVARDLRVQGEIIELKRRTQKIDDPLDPANSYLNQFGVQSSDLMNIYSGNAITDDQGYAEVILPDWFEAINEDFRYQLTVIDDANSDDFVLAKVVKQIQGGKFTIRTDQPKVTVSWQVTATAKDTESKDGATPVVQKKPKEERGKYLNPEAYGQPKGKGIGYEAEIQQMAQKP